MSLSAQERAVLADLARGALAAAVRQQKLPPRPGQLTPILQAPAGAFVTLTCRGRLRGCIGMIESCWPLAETVARMAAAAALDDLRFEPVRADELAEIQAEISVLSPLHRVSSAGEITLGRDGVLVRKAGRSGVFLPQVAEETGWSLERFLDELCEGKAGLPAQAWKSPECEMYTFTVEKITV